jgi:hypothetical protein
MNREKNTVVEVRNQIICAILKIIIATKLRDRGTIARLKELLRHMFHLSEDERTSFRERSIISAVTTKNPY